VAVQRHLGDEGNIFPDQSVFLSEYAKVGGTNGVVLLPGSVSDAHRERSRPTHPTDVDEFFANKKAHLEEMRERKAPIIAAEKASWRHPEIDVLGELKKRIEPLLESRSTGPGRRRARSASTSPTRRPDRHIVESIVVDFPGKQVRPYADEKVRYRFKTGRALIEHLIHIDEGDWVNSLFLSCRFSAARIGQYNEFVYAFFKCLSEERLQYAEGWYDEHEKAVEAEDTSSATGPSSAAART
jgi:UDP-MurNAc hydroxylase